MVDKYSITVVNLDGSVELKVYDNEEDYGDDVADYCGYGYRSHVWGRHTIVKAVEGA